MILIDTHERKSLEILFEAFGAEAVQDALAIGDVVHVEKKVLVELKIDEDVHDYARMGDELTRMNLPNYAEFRKHLIYISSGIQAFHEYKIVVGLCCKANVHPHHLARLAELPSKLRELFRDHYQKPLQISQNHSKQLGQLGSVIATFRGISDDKAWMIESQINDYGLDLKHAANLVMGENTDGSSRKVVRDMLNFFQEFSQKLGV